MSDGHHAVARPTPQATGAAVAARALGCEGRAVCVPSAVFGCCVAAAHTADSPTRRCLLAARASRVPKRAPPPHHTQPQPLPAPGPRPRPLPCCTRDVGRRRRPAPAPSAVPLAPAAGVSGRAAPTTASMRSIRPAPAPAPAPSAQRPAPLPHITMTSPAAPPAACLSHHVIPFRR